MTPQDPASQAAARAEAFLERAADFKLGSLLTERPHDATIGLAEAAQRDPAAGVAMIQRVDRDLPPVMEAALRGEAFARLESAVRVTLDRGGRVFFTGCGATGRLAILLEALWRKACRDAAAVDHEDRVLSVMAGGDFALIKSVEGFEDHEAFGRRQIEAHGLTDADTVVAVTEGGETTFVIGTAWAGVDAGAATFFVYNNPDDLLRPVARSRKVIDDERITKLNLCTGSMAVAGSTRMQATTIQLAVLGAAMERVFESAALGRAATAVERHAERLLAVIDALASEASVSALGALANREAELYRSGGRVLYFADRLLLDILTDTTERSPTFSLPPFRERGRPDAARSWSFVKDPFHDTAEAWRRMLGRPIRGLSWTRADYRDMNAPEDVTNDPPALTAATVEGFEIGREGEAEDPAAFDLRVSLLSPGEGDLARCSVDLAVRIGRDAPPAEGAGEALDLDPPLDRTPFDLPLHLAAKLALNTLSTASMAILGRLTSNWMVHVRCSNLKLIDRGIRLLIDQAGLDYETACRRLFESIVELEHAPPEQAAESPVALTLRRLQAESDDTP